MSEGTGTRRADASANDAQIVVAAGRLLARGEHPSIRDVAREAGVGSTTVYRRFPNRDLLHARAVAALVCDEIAPAVAAARRDPEPLNGLRSVTEALLQVTVQRAGGRASLAELIEEFLGRYRVDLQQLLAAAQADGTLRQDLDGDDIDGITTLTLAGLALPPHRAGAEARYAALLYDGLTRNDAPRLPATNNQTPP